MVGQRVRGRSVSVVLAACVIVGVTLGQARAADFSGWSKTLQISFAGYTKGEPLTNFPVLVALSPAITNFSYGDFASTSGGDLRFSDAFGTELNYEIDEWNTGGVSYIWVQVPLLSATNDYIQAFWGNGSQATAPAYTINGATWAGKYLGVWHFNQSGGIPNLSDSGPNRWASTNYGSNAAANGPGCSTNVASFIGHGQQFIAANNGCLVTGARDSLLLPTTNSPVSYSFWCNLRSYVTDGRAVNLHRSNVATWGSVLNNTYQTAAPNKMRVNYYNGALNGTDYTPGPATGVWHFVTTTYDGSTIRLYLNGAQVIAPAVTLTEYGNPGTFMTIGNANITNVISGDETLDEVRVVPAVLSSNWIWATWLNAASNATFCAYGSAAPQNSSIPNIVTLAATSVGGTSAVLNGDLMSTGTSQTAVFVYWGGIDGTTNQSAWANTNAFGPTSPGFLQFTASGLSNGMTYFCRYAASNASGVSWGAAQSFTTLGPPAIDNLVGASAIGPVSAVLNGNLSSTGAAPTTVYAYWDTADQGTTAGSWAHPITIGVLSPGVVATSITGLTPGQTYHYRLRAQNLYGDVWTADNPFTAATSYVWVGGGGDNNWSTGPNWNSAVAPVNNGTANVTFSGSNRPTPVADAPWNVQTLIFSNLGAAFQLSGSDLTLQAGGLSNQNTTAGRAVTIGNNIVVAGAQTWRSAGNGSSITVVNGNLSGNVGSDLSVYNNGSSSGGTTPELQLGGTNAGFAGNVLLNPTVGGAGDGLLLRRPSAMIGGNINLGGYNQCLYIDGTAGTYTFGIGTGAGQVKFRAGGNNGGGLWLTGGAATWDPGNGGNYVWGSGLNEINLGGRDATCPNAMLYIGNSSSALIFSNANKTISSSKGNSPANGQVTTLLSALSDDGSARALTTSAALLILTLPADNRGGVAKLSGATTVSGGVLAVSGMNQLFTGNLNLSGGVLLLNGVSWSDFLASRTGGYGAASNAWQITGGSSGFAARGTKVTISGGGTGDFDRDFTLGARVAYTDGMNFANAPVEIAQNTTLSSRRTLSIAPNGPGLTGAGNAGFVYTISGNFGGTGTLFVTDASTAPSLDQIPELVLAGTNTWSGSGYWYPGSGFNTGKGGMIVGNTDEYNPKSAFVRFASGAAIPSGNSGGTAYLAAILKTKVANASYANGYLLTGDGTTDGAVYTLPAGMAFLFGTINGGNFDIGGSCLGATGGKAVLRNADVFAHVAVTGDAGGYGLGLLARNDGVLVLGDTSGTVRLRPSTGLSVDSGVGGAATPIANAALGRTLVKRGEGTVVLGNMQYLDATDSADASVQFTWQLGRAISGNYGSAQYFDGAVRGVAGGGKSNSLEGFCIQFCGGVYEVDVSAGSATFSRALGTGVTNVNWRGGQNSDVGGGGFAAYSTVPGNRLTVDLNNRGRDMLYFANGGSATYDYLPGVQDSAGSTAGANVFTFGSRTANAPVDFVDNIDLNTRILPIRVWDNTNSMLDRAILSGTLQNGGIQKQGDGVLELAGSNMYQNVTIVTNGTLLVNGYLNVGGAAVTVYSGATLGGTGIINRAVSVQDGGSIWPGDLGSGTLTVSNLTLSAASLSVITAGAGGAVAVQGNLVLGGTIMVANAASRPSGTYTIMTYGGTLSGTIAVGPLPGRMAATVDLAETGKVKLRLSSPGTLFSVN